MTRIIDSKGLPFRMPPAEPQQENNKLPIFSNSPFQSALPDLTFLKPTPFKPAIGRAPLTGPPPADVSTLRALNGAALGVLFGGATSDVHHLPNVGNMRFFDQGDSNACGSTSLSMVLSYFGINIPREDIDKAIRRADNSIGATPQDEIEFARQQGLEAEGYNNGTWEEVKSMIDQGYPVMASVTGMGIPEMNSDSYSPSGTKLPEGRHQIAITGYETGPDGKEYVLFHDPNSGDTATGKGKEKKISVDDFKRAWGKSDFGVKNYFMAFGPKGSNLPPGNDDGAEGALGALNGAANVSNGFDRIFSPDNFGSFVHGIPQFFGGLVQTVGCGFGGLFQAGGSWLHDAVEGVPFLENVVQPFTDLFSGVGAVIADVFNGFGEACDSVGGAFDSLFNGDVGGFFGGLGDAACDVGGAVVNAVGDAASAIGDAISDVFSGW